MLKRLAISIGTLFVLALSVATISLVAPHAFANGISGATPFTANVISGTQASGTLAPGEVEWHQFTYNDEAGSFEQQMSMALVFTPNIGNQAQFIELSLHTPDQLDRWYAGQVNALEGLGSTFIVSRAEEADTGKIIWNGGIDSNNQYFIRVANDSDFSVDYGLFIDVEAVPQDEPVEPEGEQADDPQPEQDEPLTEAPTEEAAPEAATEDNQEMVDGLPAGIDPNHPITMEMAPNEIVLEEGKLPANSDVWFEMKVVRINGESRYPLNLTTFVTPGDGNMIHKVHLDLFPGTYPQYWSVNNLKDIREFGAGRIVERDNDPLTGELVWNGNVNNNDSYIVRLRNDNNFDIDYWLFTGDIVNTELGEPTPAPAPAVNVAPGTDPNHTIDISYDYVVEDALAPGEERWYSMSEDDLNTSTRENRQLTLYFVPNDGNNLHRVHMDIFDQGQMHIWNRGDVESTPNIGAGSIIPHDNNPETGELFWDGWLVDGNVYVVRVRNSGDKPINYWLFSDNVYNLDLGNIEAAGR